MATSKNYTVKLFSQKLQRNFTYTVQAVTKDEAENRAKFRMKKEEEKATPAELAQGQRIATLREEANLANDIATARSMERYGI